MTNPKFPCERCNKLFRNRSMLMSKGKHLCRLCYRNHVATIIRLPKLEPFKNPITLNLNLSDTQKKFYRQRYKELGVIPRDYFKALLNADMRNLKKGEGGSFNN